MRKFLYTLLLTSISSLAIAQTATELKRVGLPNGWSLSPVGKSLALGDLPLNMAVSASGKYIAVTNNGQSVQSIQLIDTKSDQLLHTEEIKKSWYGLKFSADERWLYASGGNDNWILKYAVKNSKLVLADSIKLGDKWPVKISPSGIEVDDSRNRLWVVTKENNSLYVVDLKTNKIIFTQTLGAEGYACILSPNKKYIYITVWGGDKVLVMNANNFALEKTIAVGDNPNEMCVSKNGRYLFVANANDNSVSVIDAKQAKVIETLNAALYPDAPSGSTSNGVALSGDEKTLYIANADNNCLAVFDFSKPGYSKSKGFIPTGWYPTNVKVLGKKIYVTNGKGFSSAANVKGPDPTKKEQEVNYQQADYHRKQDKMQYIGGLFKGTMSIITVPSEKLLAQYSEAVYKNTLYTKEKEKVSIGEEGNPIPRKVGDPSPIKYVFYIIKENRTYDQVLGDVSGGNGDTSLVLFGEKITPNQHKLVKEFVLLDNFYVDGEVSADGHNWTMGAYATDYLEKNWPTSYGNRGGNYPGEGKREIANNKGGFIWDLCKRSGVSYRTYGEFADDNKPNIPVLKDHLSLTYTGWDMGVRDTTRFYQWQREFDSMVIVNAVPQFNSLRFGNDHTEGLRKGKPTPYAHAADNDLAVGMFVEHLSKSPIWKESVVFIVEDDAQNGPDHVDAHRTTAYVAGGYVKRKLVDHTMYSTSSMLRTMELILGMPPMTQYDAAAESMWRCFTSSADITGFTAVASNIDLAEKNVVINEWQRRSESFNLAKEDAIPDLEFSKVLWHGLKGDDVPFPGPRRAAFIKVREDEDEDEDD